MSRCYPPILAFNKTILFSVRFFMPSLSSVVSAFSFKSSTHISLCAASSAFCLVKTEVISWIFSCWFPLLTKDLSWSFHLVRSWTTCTNMCKHVTVRFHTSATNNGSQTVSSSGVPAHWSLVHFRTSTHIFFWPTSASQAAHPVTSGHSNPWPLWRSPAFLPIPGWPIVLLPTSFPARAGSCSSSSRWSWSCQAATGRRSCGAGNESHHLATQPTRFCIERERGEERKRDIMYIICVCICVCVFVCVFIQNLCSN